MHKKSNLGKHTKNSFIEAKAIRILSEFIEEGGNAKTFFNENDKTPNHDGFFEILGSDNAPKKQFIVQIKGTGNLQPISSGKNRGKYKYVLNTKFFNYVKEKITENPAIYFVVDTENNKIFWIYLSDEKLMSLDFEGKQKITYYLSEQEICDDIAKFLKELDIIASERNQLFLYKTPEEIAEIQDAIYYMNNLFDNDLKFIKDLAFPNLWRFGIANSKLPPNDLTMTIGDKVITNDVSSNVFSIYPQERGLNDSGIREVNSFFNGVSFYHYIDMLGTSTQMSYINDVISQILKEFFDTSLIINLLPKKVVSEILSEYIKKFENYFKIKIGNHISKIEKSIHIIAKYLMYILNEDSLTDNENKLKQSLNIHILRQQKSYLDISIDPFFIISESNCCNNFINFYKKQIKDNITSIQPYAIILNYLEKNFIEYIVAIDRAKAIDMNKVTLPKIGKPKFIYGSKEDKYGEVKEYCEDWFKNLEKIYIQTYKSLFRDDTYLNSGEYQYEIIKPVIDLLAWNLVKYKNKKFHIKESDHKIDVFHDEHCIASLTGLGLSSFVNSNKTLYYSIKCLLYQGICKKLEVECKGINFSYQDNKIFEI